MIFTAVLWTKRCGPQLLASCNSSDAKSSEWRIDAIC